jgi:hypothetical protein
MNGFQYGGVCSNLCGLPVLGLFRLYNIVSVMEGALLLLLVYLGDTIELDLVLAYITIRSMVLVDLAQRVAPF